MSKSLTTASPFSRVIGMVVNGMSPNTKRAYSRALADFVAWYEGMGHQELNKAVILEYQASLDAQGMGKASISQRLSALRKLAREAADNGLIDQQIAAGIERIKSPKASGNRSGNWLTLKEAQALLRKPDTETLKGLRDRAILATFLGCGLRRNEASELTFAHIKLRDARWVILDLDGKGGRVRTVPMPAWAKKAIDEYANAAQITRGKVFRPVNKAGRLTGTSITDKALRDVVAEYAPGLAPHDLRRSYAKLAYKGGAELDQIQLTLGHANIGTTQRYLGAELELHNAPGDHIGLRI